MKKILLVLLLMLGSLSVFADDTKLDWVGPGEREDNTPYLPEERGGFRIHDTFDNSVLDIPDKDAITHTFNNVPVGTHGYTIRAYDTEGRLSDWSSEVIIQIFEEVILPPKPPTLSVTVLSVGR